MGWRDFTLTPKHPKHPRVLGLNVTESSWVLVSHFSSTGCRIGISWDPPNKLPLKGPLIATGILAHAASGQFGAMVQKTFRCQTETLQMGIHLKVLRESYPMDTNMTRFRWLSKMLCPLDESSLSIERVNVSHHSYSCAWSTLALQFGKPNSHSQYSFSQPCTNIVPNQVPAFDPFPIKIDPPSRLPALGDSAPTRVTSLPWGSRGSLITIHV